MGVFEGKTVLVRGGGRSRGVGYDVAGAFAREGANLAVIAWNKSRAQGARELEDMYGVQVLPLWAVGDGQDDIERAVSSVISRFGGIDVLVNCALVARAELADEVSVEDLRTAYEVNCLVPFSWMRACRGSLAKRNGSIINFLSASAASGLPGSAAIASSVQALRALSLVTSREWEDEGVRVNMVEAHARTGQFERWAQEFPDEAQAVLAQITAQDAGEAYDDVGQACLYLAEPDGHLTGATLKVGYRDVEGR